jgi:hypothetical protein
MKIIGLAAAAPFPTPSYTPQYVTVTNYLGAVGYWDTASTGPPIARRTWRRRAPLAAMSSSQIASLFW